MKKSIVKKRELGLDILKGVAVITMVLAHSVAFLHNDSSQFLRLVRQFGDTVSFSVFMFASGASVYLAYLKHTVIDDDDLFNRIINRVMLLLVGYYFVAVVSSVNSFPSDIEGIIDQLAKIALFIKVPGYTEFLIPFIVYTLLLIPFKKVLRLIGNSVVTAIFVGLVFYFVGFVIFKYTDHFPYKALLVGEQGRYSFPLFQYFGVFLIGLSWGKWMIEQKVKKERRLLSASMAFVLTIALLVLEISGFVGDLTDMELRWPPSLAFILLGLIFSYFMSSLTEVEIDSTGRISFITSVLVKLGRSVFSIYIIHITLFQIYSLVHAPKNANLAYPIIGFMIVLTLSYLIVTIMGMLTVRNAQTSNKKATKKFVKLNYKLFGVVALLLLLVSGAKGYTYVLADNRREPPKPPVVENPVVKPNFFWWDDDYAWFKQIIATNNYGDKVQENSWASVDFDHALLVSQHKALPTGNDFKLGYFDGKKYIEVPLKVENPDKADTKIVFKLTKAIDKDQVDMNYFLYYGNASAKSYNKVDELESITPVLGVVLTTSSEKSHPDLLTVNRRWYLKGKGTTSDENTIEITFYPKSTIGDVIYDYYVLDTDLSGQLVKKNNMYEATIDTDTLEPGTFQLQVKSLDSTTKSNTVTFNVSYPLYISWTMDWEGYDCREEYLNMITKVSDQYSVPITHFYNPRIYVGLSKNRQDYFDKWIKNRRDEHGDEIELHLHMFFDMVKAAGVEPKKTPQWANYKDGKDVPTTAYTVEEMEQILNWSVAKFEERGLGTPIAFRGGAWYANTDTLKAIENTGFLIDASGRSKYAWGTNKIPGYWDLKSTTKPYKPSRMNQNMTTKPTFDLWEFPNNGADSWTYSAEQMISRFNDNYKNKPMTVAQTVTYLSHPHGFNVDEPKIKALFDHISKNTFVNDRGPVKFVTLAEAFATWR